MSEDRIETEEEAAEEVERQHALILAREFKQMTQTAGWARVRQILADRPAQVAIASLKDERPKDYWRGRLDESEWLAEELARVVAQGEELQRAESEKRKADEAAVRMFVGRGRGGGLA